LVGQHLHGKHTVGGAHDVDSLPADSRQQIIDSRQQTADRRQQIADSRQQATADNGRQQQTTADNSRQRQTTADNSRQRTFMVSRRSVVHEIRIRSLPNFKSTPL
jgi:hypothetical protein